MERVNEVKPVGGVQGEGSIFAINNNAEPGLATLRYKLRDASMEAAEEPFEAGGKKFNRGSLIVRRVGRSDFDPAATETGLHTTPPRPAPRVLTHPLRAPPAALFHTSPSPQPD